MKRLGGYTLLVLLGMTLASGIHSQIGLQVIPDANIAITYADLITILLTAVTAMVSLLGIVIAILAFIGWQSIGKRVEETSTRIMATALGDGGDLHATVKKEVQQILYKDIRPIDSEFAEDEENQS